MDPGVVREAEFQNKRRALPVMPWEQGWIGRALGYQRPPCYELPISPPSGLMGPVGNGASSSFVADAADVRPPAKRFRASQPVGLSDDRSAVLKRWVVFLCHDMASSAVGRDALEDANPYDALHCAVQDILAG
eukprot:4006350-Amphidinium_carterae.1